MCKDGFYLVRHFNYASWVGAVWVSATESWVIGGVTYKKDTVYEVRGEDRMRRNKR